MTPLRLLVLSHSASPHVVRPIDSLLQLGHQIVLVSAQNPWPDGRSHFRHFFFDGSFKRLTLLLKEIGRIFMPHIVHVHYAWLQVFCSVQANIAPVVVSIWGSDINDFVKITSQGYSWRLFMPRRYDLRWALPKVARVIVDDATMFDKCRFIAPDCAPIEFLHLGVDIQQFHPPTKAERTQARRELGFLPDDIVLFSPRAMSYLYNHHVILRNFAKIAQEYPKAHLVFKKYIPSESDKDKNYAVELEREASAMQCTQQIHFIQSFPQNKLHILYWASDAIINYPQQDGFPVTLVEAAATHTPIITKMLPAYKGTFVEKYIFRIIDNDYDFNDIFKDIFDSLMIYKNLYNDIIQELKIYRFDQYIDRLLQIYIESMRDCIDNVNFQHKIEKTTQINQEYLRHKISKKYINTDNICRLCKKIIPSRIKLFIHLYLTIAGNKYEKIS